MVDIILDSRFGEKIHHLAKTAISHLSFNPLFQNVTRIY